jgi:mono/diheme cytochrome c family protein
LKSVEQEIGAGLQKPISPPTRDRKRPHPPRRLLNQRNTIIGFVVVCLLALVVFAVRSGSRPATLSLERADVTNAQALAQGRQVYLTRCAGCHGSDLKGAQGWPQRGSNGVMPASPLDASGRAWQRDDQWLFITIKQGGQATAAPGDTSGMPAFAGLTDADIWAVVSYIKSAWPKDIQDAQPRRALSE